MQLTLTLSDRAETGYRTGQALSRSCSSLSIIYHHLFMCLCLFTSPVSIHLCPASHPPSQLPSCSLQHLCNTLLSVPPTFDLQCVGIYIHAVTESLCFLSVSQELSIKTNCLCICPSVCLFSLCVSVPRDIVLLMGRPFEADSALATELWQKL